MAPSETPSIGGNEFSRRASVRLPPSPASCRLAREIVRQVTGQTENLRVALIVTEMVGNAVAHANAAPTLTVVWDGSLVHIEVFDDGPGWPVVREVEATATSGRGVALVDAMADGWGVEAVEGGKVVWADANLANDLAAWIPHAPAPR